MPNVAPEEAEWIFELLSDGTRLDIVRVLYTEWERAPMNSVLPFSALCARIDGGDTGRFNYHLARLQEGLVVRREGGYTLTPLGIRMGHVIDETAAAHEVKDPAP